VAGRYHYRINAPFGILTLFEDSGTKPFYQGRAVTRGIKCDVWQQRLDNWPEDVEAKTIWRWYFTRTDWRENAAAQPVRFLISIFLVNKRQCMLPNSTLSSRFKRRVRSCERIVSHRGNPLYRITFVGGSLPREASLVR